MEFESGKRSLMKHYSSDCSVYTCRWAKKMLLAVSGTISLVLTLVLFGGSLRNVT